MKKWNVMIVCALAAMRLQAQTMSQMGGNISSTSVPLEKHATMLLGAGGNTFQSKNLVNNNDLALPSYNGTGKVEGSFYFNKDWAEGTVTTLDNQVYGNGLLFMYDKGNGYLFYKHRDSPTTWQADLSKVVAFTLIADKPCTFIKADLFNKDYPGEFFEILLLDEKKYSLVKSVKTVLQPSSASAAAQAMTQSMSSPRYIDKTRYFIFKGGTLTEVGLRKKALEEALGADSGKAEAYFRTHNGSFNEQGVVSLLTAVNAELD